jgi:Alginate lyase
MGESSGLGGGTSGARESSAAGDILLDEWKLTLPVNSAGERRGRAVQLQTAVLTPPWLTRHADGALDFWAPAVGATTPNSRHARTELVSKTQFAFGISGGHVLNARASVMQVPSSAPDVCVAQIHGAGSLTSVPFVMVHWRDGAIVVVIKQALRGSSSRKIVLLAGVPLGAPFGLTVGDGGVGGGGDGSIELSAECGGRTIRERVEAPSPFVGTEQRFQVGAYQQAVGRSAEGGEESAEGDGARVTIHALVQS